MDNLQHTEEDITTTTALSTTTNLNPNQNTQLDTAIDEITLQLELQHLTTTTILSTLLTNQTNLISTLSAFKTSCDDNLSEIKQVQYHILDDQHGLITDFANLKSALEDRHRCMVENFRVAGNKHNHVLTGQVMLLDLVNEVLGVVEDVRGCLGGRSSVGCRCGVGSPSASMLERMERGMKGIEDSMATARSETLGKQLQARQEFTGSPKKKSLPDSAIIIEPSKPTGGVESFKLTQQHLRWFCTYFALLSAVKLLVLVCWHGHLGFSVVEQWLLGDKR